MDREQILGWLKARLKPGRLRHTLGVEAMAVHLAGIHGVDPEKAALAALVHDCAKWMDDQALIHWAHGVVPMDPYYEAAPQLLHGPAAVRVAQEALDVTDADVLHAVCFHTLPDSTMSPLDKVVFLADMVEEGRSYPGVEALRALCEKDLDAAFMEALIQTITFTLHQGHPVHPATLEYYNHAVLSREK